MRKVAVLSFIMVIAILLGLNGWLVLHPVYAVDEQTHCTAKCKEPCKEVECIGDNCGATDNVGCYATSGGQINIKRCCSKIETF